MAPSNLKSHVERGARLAGKFDLVREVAKGGMGTVWAARNVMTGADVAVKILHPHRQNDDDAALRFRHEAKLSAALAHRNITRVFDLVEVEDGSLVLVMELLRGETLRDYLTAKKALPTREAVAIVIPVLSALQHAHERGVIHRDLKPSNICLHVDPDGQMIPKLLDFGIAKARGSSIETRTGDALGTPSYMSPEQVRAKDLDGRSDLFSVGVVLYELITGKNPFQGATPTATLVNVIELEIDPEPEIDPRLWLELHRALNKQPYARHASAKELAAALCGAIGESELSLTQSLRREPVIDETPPAQSTSMEIAVQAEALPPRSRTVRPVLIGGGAAILFALALFLLLRPPAAPRSEPRPATAVVTATPTAKLDDASPLPIEPAAKPAAPIEPASPRPTPRRAPKAKPTPSAKPIARTPGF